MNLLLLLLVLLAAGYAFYRTQRDTPGGRFSTSKRDDDVRSASDRWGDGGWIVERTAAPEAEGPTEPDAEVAEGDDEPEWHEPLDREQQRRKRRAARAARRGGGVVADADGAEPGAEPPRPSAAP